MGKFIKENWFKLVVLLLVGVIIGLAFYYLFVFNQRLNLQNSSLSNQTQSQQGNNNDLASSFVCPENYASPQEQTDAVAKFISTYSKLFPDATVEEMFIYRYHLLVSRLCDKTLAKMLQAVVPLDQMLRFEGKDFGPQTTQFTKDTGVWSSYFTLNGQGFENPDEELIFNFYLQNVWANEAISAEHVAQVVADSYAQSNNAHVIYKFTAPDTTTKNPDFFIFSDVIYPEQDYGYIYATKISSVQNSVFSITYSKRFTADAANLQNDIDDWLAQDLKLTNGYSKEIGNIGVDVSWPDFLINKQK
jgi:hypothetical protein